MNGSQVWEAFQQDRFGEIRDYCETDALNTYLLYLRWEYIRGNLTEAQLIDENELVKSELKNQKKAHFDRFLQAWRDDDLG